jgi:cysteine sulfinate desulfinase/cysteine desulfurase-like protein
VTSTSTHTGTGLYAESQVRRHADPLTTQVFGNPHSFSATSSASTEAIERCRQRILRLLHIVSDVPFGRACDEDGGDQHSRC